MYHMTTYTINIYRCKANYFYIALTVSIDMS